MIIPETTHACKSITMFSRATSTAFTPEKQCATPIFTLKVLSIWAKLTCGESSSLRTRMWAMPASMPLSMTHIVDNPTSLLTQEFKVNGVIRTITCDSGLPRLCFSVAGPLVWKALIRPSWQPNSATHALMPASLCCNSCPVSPIRLHTTT